MRVVGSLVFSCSFGRLSRGGFEEIENAGGRGVGWAVEESDDVDRLVLRPQRISININTRGVHKQLTKRNILLAMVAILVSARE